MRRVFLSGADVILPDRIESNLTVVLEGDRIADFVSGPREFGRDETRVHLSGCVIAPGFIDVHAHGVLGHDVLDADNGLEAVATAMPRFGVTAFCPTSIACSPVVLSRFLRSVADARAARPTGARVLPAHLESNFINPVYAGAQPVGCLRSPAASAQGTSARARVEVEDDAAGFSGRDVIAVIDERGSDVGIVTLAPELDGGVELVEHLAARGIRVSLGHSGATFEQAQAAISRGARHATHLFNRMASMSHREPGLAGAVLANDEIAAEIICDGHHVHAAFVQMAIASKGRDRIMAITDATAGAGLPRGSMASLGGRPIRVEEVARLEDGTFAGSTTTMDRVFAWLAGTCGLNLREAVEVCSTTPAREMGLVGHGVIVQGSVADLVVLDRSLTVRQTWIAGRPVWAGTSAATAPSSQT